MKKLLLLLLTIVTIGFLAAPLSAQETVTIGTGTTTTYVTPFNSLWGYSFVEQIYTAEEIGTSGEITTVRFYHKPSSTPTAVQTNSIELYMKEVTRETFSSTSDFEVVTANDIVYTGNFVIPIEEGWITIELNTPFSYSGTSNLMIAMHEFTSGYSSRYFAYTATTGSVVTYHSDSANPDPYDLGSYSGNKYVSPNRANVQLEIMPSGDNPCYKPNNFVVSNITESEATLSWTPREGQDAWQVCYSTE